VAFPQILEPMYDKLDWTQKLGDAFLAQERMCSQRYSGCARVPAMPATCNRTSSNA
jgi:hypothetical protein